MAELVWTEQQSRAIRAEGDVLLVANAGTGKTTTVVGKLLWRLGLPFGVDASGESLEPPERPCRLSEIAAITFTEKAAYDLKRKLREAIEASPRAEELRWEVDRASIGTIHSFCGELLREHALRLGIDPGFRILDAADAGIALEGLVKELVLERLEAGDPGLEALLEDFSLADGEHTKGVVGHVADVVRDLRWHPERYRGWLRTEGPDAGEVLDRDALRDACEEWDEADELGMDSCETLLRLGLAAREAWDRHLEEENARDFDSLILDARKLLTGTHGEVALRGIRARTRVLVIDEFQDTDFAQRDIAFAVGRGTERTQMFLVGDPKQSIYRFRGADVSVWNEVERELSRDGEVVALTRNFRCAPVIVDFVNAAAGAAMERMGARLPEATESRVRYAPLEAGLDPDPEAEVEWLEADGERAEGRRQAEGRAVAGRILEMVGRHEILDPESRVRRPLEFRDCAILYRNRTGLEHYEAALTRHGVPYFLSGAPHLSERQEILDVVNALRLIRNPRDDLRAFGFLRSPFVGLRDEVLASIRLLSSRAPLLRQAERALESDDWFESPEHSELARVEREALGRGLQLLEQLRRLAPRIPIDELIEELLERSGYRLHLLLLGRAEEPLTNLQSLLHFAAGHREHDIASFLEVWERNASQDTGLPQAPLYSKEDDVVALSTIHRAKGLEWPVVFLIDASSPIQFQRTNAFWSDRSLGPILCPRKDDRGGRGRRMHEIERLEELAEEARLFYVAVTRARDRLVVTGPRAEIGSRTSYAEWLAHGVAADVPVAFRDPAEEIRSRRATAPPRLEWLDRLRLDEPSALVKPLPEAELAWVHSATELMLREQDAAAWERRYRHGIEPSWRFAPETGGDGAEIPPTVRGTVIHGVLERIEEARELSRILDETIGALDEPELEPLMAPGTRYRETLEKEIEAILASEEWRGYVEGEHWRELEFFHLVGERNWRLGAFDLYRPREESADLIVDFKTHPIGAGEVEKVAREYRVQARIYAAAGEIAGPVSVRLHFTYPNVVVEAL